jgi:hypothetical protein
MRSLKLHTLALVALSGMTGIAAAGPDITEFDIGFNVQSTQTAAGVSAPNAFYFSARVQQDANAYNQASLAYPGPGSPQALTLLSGGTLFNFETSSFSTKAALDTAYPFGTYTASVTNTTSGATNTDTINYTQTAYTSSTPALTQATYLGLQGLNASKSFTFNFNAQTPNPLADAPYTFLTIFGPNGFSLSVGSFLPPGTTSVTLPANALMPDTQYSFDLDFSDRIVGSSTTSTFTLFDVRTDGAFTTAAVPEPCGLLLAGVALAAAVVRARDGRKFRQRVATLFASNRAV